MHVCAAALAAPAPGSDHSGDGNKSDRSNLRSFSINASMRNAPAQPCARTEDSSGFRRRSATAAFTGQPHIDSDAFLMCYVPAPRCYFLDLGQHLTDRRVYFSLHRRNGPLGARAHGQPAGIDVEVIRDGKQAGRFDALVPTRKPVRNRGSGNAAMTCQFSFASAPPVGQFSAAINTPPPCFHPIRCCTLLGRPQGKVEGFC